VIDLAPSREDELHDRITELEAQLDKVRELSESWMQAAAHDFTEGNDPSGIAYTDCANELQQALENDRG